MGLNTTSHNQDHSSMSVFGVINNTQLNFDYTVMMVTLIVFFVVFIEKFFEFLKHLTNDTPFCKVIPALEGELMVVGFTAFVFKIYLNAASSISHEYHYALEYSDILVPFFSFSGCFFGMFLIVISIKLSDNWSKGYHANNYALINDFFQQYHSWRYWIPTIVNPTMHRIEFKILHHVFCEMFKLKKSSFAYDEYVELVFEKFILRLIHTDPVHWLLFFALLVAEWARSKLQITITSCPPADSSGSTAHDECLSVRSTNTFLMAGAVMYCISWIFVVASRYYELCFIRIKGIQSMEFYPAYLYYMEKNQPEELRSLKDIRKDEDDLKKLVSAAIERLELAKRKGSQFQIFFPSVLGKDASIKPTQVKQKRVVRTKKIVVHDSEKNYGHLSKETIELNASLNTTGDGVHKDIHHSHPTHTHGVVRDDLADDDMHNKSFSPEHLADFIESDSYFGEKQKHAPTIDAVSMTNVIHALYSPPLQKRGKNLGSRDFSDDGEGYQDEREDMSVRSFKASTRYRSSLGSIENDAHSYSDEDLETGKLPVCEKGDGSRKDKHPRRKITAAEKEASLQSDGKPQSIGNVSSGNIRKDSGSGKNSTTDKNTSTNNSRHAVADNIWNSYASAFHQKKDTHLRDTNIFFLSRPYLYFEGIKLLLMLMALYCALWLIQYLPAHTINAQSKVLCVVPLLLTFFNFVIVVKSAVLLKAIHEIDRESMMEVIEQTEGARSLEDLIRSRLLERLNEMEEDEDGEGEDDEGDHDGQDGIRTFADRNQDKRPNNNSGKSQCNRNLENRLNELFLEIDNDKDGLLSRSELTRFLHSLDIYFSRRKWQQIFRQMDRNQDDDELISITEFSMFVFPESSSALEEDKIRIQKLKEEAKRQTLEFARVLEKLHPKK